VKSADMYTEAKKPPKYAHYARQDKSTLKRLLMISRKDKNHPIS